MVFRRSLVPILALVTVAAAACGGGGDRPTRVAAGGAPPASATTAATSSTVPPAADATVPAPTSTTIVASDVTGSPSADSPVDGLRADQLKAALEAPVAAAARSRSGPTVDQVVLADGTRVWRVRVPGSFEARSARLAIDVGGRRVGLGVLAADLQAVTAVTTDGSGLLAGSAVSYRWEGGPSVPAGSLAVVR
jgi:hypothetical protein